MVFAALGPWLPLVLLAPSLGGGASAVSIKATAVTQPSLEATESTRSTRSTGDAQARVGALINEGQALFDTADYDGAIDRWTTAYAALPDDPHLAAARNLLIYQIAQAHIEAFAMDPQPSHLRKAGRLLRQYIAALDLSETEAHADAERRLAAIEAQIRATPSPPTASRRPPVPGPAPHGAVPTWSARQRGPLLLTGGISLSLGGALLVSTAWSAVTSARIDEERKLALERGAGRGELDRLLARDTRANQATIATAIAGGVLIATGIALVVKASVRPRPLTAQPVLAPGLIGARLSLHF